LTRISAVSHLIYFLSFKNRDIFVFIGIYYYYYYYFLPDKT
jgi:hypothetical protein